MNIMSSNMGLETNLVLGLSHLQRVSARRPRCPRNDACKAVRSDWKANETGESGTGDKQHSPPGATEPQSPSSPRKLWRWRKNLSPPQGSKTRRRKNSKGSINSSSSGSLDYALPVEQNQISIQELSSHGRSKWPWRRRSRSDSGSSKQKGKTHVENEPTEVGRDCFDNISDISDSEHPDMALVLEADIRDPVAPHDESNLSTAWNIQVLDDNIEVVQTSASQTATEGGQQGAPWFRIYFHREDDFVYYQGREVIDYVRDLVELDGSFIFAVTIMSSGVSTLVGAAEILTVLNRIVSSAASEFATEQNLPGLIANSSESTGGDNPVIATSTDE